MSEWGTGHVDEIPYTYGYCDELNPLRLNLALLRAGLALPAVHNACELGFGHGVSVNIHAAGSITQWHGTDFNPVHANFAQQLARDAGAHAQLSAERFSDFCSRDDLPAFDYIGMHGIWSWISPDNREVLLDFLRRKLKAGGVLYISYNTQPGWAAMQPVRELMNGHFQASAVSAQHAAVHAAVHAEPSVPVRIKAAVDFAQRVFATHPGFAVVNPLLAERVDALSHESPPYLAHEYFNRDWEPTYFSQVASSLAGAGLTYAVPARYVDHIDALNLTTAQRALLSGIADISLRETTRDFCTNQSLRRDYWIKAPRPLGDDEKQAALRAQRVILALPRAAVVLKVRGALSETTLPAALYGPILDALDSHRPETLQYIEDSVRTQGIALPRIVDAVMVLVSMGVLLNAQDNAQIRAARPSAAKLNAAICEQARHHGELQFLVSPVSGSGIRVPRVPQLFLLARLHQMQQPEQWAEYASETLRVAACASVLVAGHGLGVSSSQSISADTDLKAQAQRFAEVHLPILQALGVA
jgi:SAM-dependent methyltransferase